MSSLSKISVDINYPQDRPNLANEVETSLRQGKTLIDFFRQREELALLMADNEALDPKDMTPEQRDAQQEWVEASMREEAEDAFALDQADETDAQTMTPEDIVSFREENADKEEYVN